MSTDPDPGDLPGFGPADEEAPRRRHPVFLAGVMIAIAAVAGVGGYLYSRLSGSAPAGGEVPLVRAEPGPTKKRPDKPGGMTIPNQDKLVYQAITDGAGEKAEPKVERLLPPPEEPLSPPKPPAPQPAASPAKAAPAPAAQPAEAAPKTTSKTAKKTSPPPAPTKTASAAAPKTASKTAAKATAGAYLVQIAAFRSRAKADAAWTRLAKAHRDLLGKLTPLVRRADLGAEKGVYFRLRAGPLASAAEARALCAKLKARKLDCLVVKP